MFPLPFWHGLFAGEGDGPFTPASLPDLTWWFEDDQNVYTNNPPTNPANINDPVRFWGNLAAPDHDFILSSPMNPPTRTGDGLEFNTGGSASTRLQITNPASMPNTACTGFIIANETNDDGFAAISFMPALHPRYDVTGKAAVHTQGGAQSITSAQNTSLNTDYIFTYVVNGASSLLAVNNSPDNTGTLFTPPLSYSPFLMGNNAVDGDWSGYIKAFILYTGVLSQADRFLVRDYLNEKYAIY